MRPLTVKQLQDKLAALVASGVPEDAEVVIDGCDCVGDAGDVADDGKGPGWNRETGASYERHTVFISRV